MLVTGMSQMPPRTRTPQESIRRQCLRRVMAMTMALALGACGGDGENGSPSTNGVAVDGIFAGGDNTCAVLHDSGAVFCWGANQFGQVGDGSTVDRLSPSAVAGAPLSTLPVPGDHTCSTRLATDLYCWGRNSSGELGTEDSSDAPTPRAIAQGGGGWWSVAVGDDFTCALYGANTVFCMGANDVGQLGTGLPQSEAYPRVTWNAHLFNTVAAAGRTACAIAQNDTHLFCWGDGTDGQLGNGQFDVTASVPTLVPGDLHFTSVAIGANAAGQATVCAVAEEGAFCWGKNGDGEIGDGTTDRKNTPTRVAGLDQVTQLAPGGSHTCAELASGKVFCWGRGGRLGNGSSAASLTPVPVSGGHVFAGIFAGRDHTCGRTDGDPSEAYCWGENSRGQLGDGTTESRLAPLLVPFQ